MNRRELLAATGIALSTWVLPADAEPQKVYRIGVLGIMPPSAAECTSPHRDAYQHPKCWIQVDLHALGWREGETVQIEQRFGNGDAATLPPLANELVALRPDLLIAIASTETQALQAATSDIPVVFMQSTDPVGVGIVESISHPGRNTTGIATAPQILWGKRLELIVELLGKQPAGVAWLGNPGNGSVATKLNLSGATESAEKMGIKLESFEAHQSGELDRVFAAAAGSDALLLQADPMFFTQRRQIAALATRYKLPVIYDNKGYVFEGGLVSYGTDVRENFRLGARYVDRILKGVRPGDLPVQQASRFELVINLNAAKAIGLTVPPSLLARADEVIE